jgi:predicted nucleic acid-binding protein
MAMPPSASPVPTASFTQNIAARWHTYAIRAFRLVTSAEILAELGDVLQRPAFRRYVELSDFDIMRAIRGLRGVAKMGPGA